MCLPTPLVLTRPTTGSSLASLLVVLMEYPLPGPVIALLSQEKAALAPKSYLISSCKKSIKITLVYAKDQQTEEGQHLATSAVASSSGAVASARASTSKASSASSLLSSSSSLSSSAERKKPRHASSSSKTSRKKKKKSKNSRKSSRSTPSGIVLPRVSKLSESSTSPTSDLEALCSGARCAVGGAGNKDRNLSVELPPNQNGNPERDEDSCSTPEFPLLFGGHDGEMIGRERMSTVDSGVPSSNGTMAYEQTAESGASDEDHDTHGIVGTKTVREELSERRDRPAVLPKERTKAGLFGHHSKKDNEASRILPVDLPRRIRGISDSSISSLSSSDTEKEKESSNKTTKDTQSNPTALFASEAKTSSASTSRILPGSETPVRRQEQWQTWTRIPRIQAPPTFSRQKSTAVPSVSARPPTTTSALNAGVGGIPRAPTQSNPHGAANQNEGGGASWDGSENL